MTTQRSIAVAQTVPRAGDVATNVREHLRLVSAARDHAAQVLVFPELSLIGYELDLASELAFSEHDPRLDPLRQAAIDARLLLVIGAPVRCGKRLHIGAFLLVPDGSIDHVTKQHLGAFAADANPIGAVPPAESTVFDPGDRAPLASYGTHVAAVAICADSSRPEHPRSAADRGADTYLASVFVPPSDVEGDAVRLQGYAARHALVVAMANFGGPSGGLPGGGRSAIWSPAGELLVELPARGAGVAVARESDGGWQSTIAMLDRE